MEINFSWDVLMYQRNCARKEFEFFFQFSSSPVIYYHRRVNFIFTPSARLFFLRALMFARLFHSIFSSVRATVRLRVSLNLWFHWTPSVARLSARGNFGQLITRSLVFYPSGVWMANEQLRVRLFLRARLCIRFFEHGFWYWRFVMAPIDDEEI